MAVVADGTTLETYWDVRSASDQSVDAIGTLAGLRTPQVIFVGETHTSPFDKARNLKIAEALIGDARVFVIAERAIFKVNDSRILQAANAWNEPVREDVGSFQDSRNVETVAAIARVLAEDKANGRSRPVVVFFGSDHEQRFRTLLAKTLKSVDKVSWCTLPSVMDVWDRLPFRDQTALPAPVLIGFATTANYVHQQLEFLSKGKVGVSFNLYLQSGAGSYASGMHAIYCEGTYPGLAAIDMAQYTRGSASTLVHPPGPGGHPSLTAVPVDRNEYQRLLDLLMTRLND